VPIETTIPHLDTTQLSKDDVLAYLQTLGFQSLIKRLKQPQDPKPAQVKKKDIQKKYIDEQMSLV